MDHRSRSDRDLDLDEAAVLSLLVEHSADLLARHAPDGTYLYVSPACRRLLGFEPEELVGRDPYEFVHPDDLAGVREQHAQLLGGADEITLTFRWRRGDGRYAWFETRTRIVRAPGSDQPTEILSSTRDISVRRRAQERFERSFADAPIGMGLAGLDGRFIQVNGALCELLGRTADELLGLPYEEISHPQDLAAERDSADALQRGDIDRYSLEKRYLHRDGRTVWALLRVSLVRDEGGRPLHTIKQVVDLTARRQVEEELRRTNAELQQFAEVASHDLRSPLVTVQGILSLLLERYESSLGEEAARWLQRATSQTGALTAVVDALLGLAQAGNRPLRYEDVALDEVVAYVREVLEPELEAAGAELRAGPLPDIRGDGRLLGILFQNLLGNAVKHRRPDRPLVVEVAATREESPTPAWRIVVEDTGRGFAEADRDRIFEPFGRTSEGEKLEGAGIGLATCRRIVERHGGAIHAEPLPTGARFVVTLPDAATARVTP